MQVETTKEVKLVARICQSTNDPCTLCGRWRERTVGDTETYLAETESWVCEECAFQVDADLARFAYDGVHGKPRLSKSEIDHFGHCPECGHANTFLNVHKTHWFYCPKHGLRWCVGYNLISSWQHQDEHDWQRNEALLLRMRETEPYYPGPSLMRRIRLGMRRFWASVRSKSIYRNPINTVLDDTAPF